MSDARRYRIHALTDLAALNHRLDVARKERERIESVLKATQREVVDAASKGTQPSPETMRTLTEFSTRDGVSFAEVVGAQYDHGNKAPALRAELDRAHEDPEGTYDTVLAALTERHGTPDEPSPWSRKDGRATYWTIETWTADTPRWCIARATLGVVEEVGRGVFVFGNGSGDRMSRRSVPHTFVSLAARAERRIAGGEWPITGCRTPDEIVAWRRATTCVAPASVALAAIDELVRAVRESGTPEESA